MSTGEDLRKRLLNSAMPGLPPRPGIGGLGLPPRPMGGGLGRPNKMSRPSRNYEPLDWRPYYDEKKRIKFKGLGEKEHFNIYVKRAENNSPEVPLVVFLHGAGYSGLTWSLSVKDLVEKVRINVISVDLRGHGETFLEDEDKFDFDILSTDVIEAVKSSEFGAANGGVIFVGHSMGGALAVHTALKAVELLEEASDDENVLRVKGICVIDVVEGTALDALSSMQSVLRSRPKAFKSLSNAVEWSLRSNLVRNNEAARVSMPGQLKCSKTGRPGSECIDQESQDGKTEDKINMSSLDPNAIKEDEEEDSSEDFVKPVSPQEKKTKVETTSTEMTWRIDLFKTEPFWRSWFEGLSNKFLSVPAAKLLLLAGLDRLDRDLTVGQMQGKFQMQVLPQSGHAVHEDQPEKVADILASFLTRNKFADSLEGFTPQMPGSPWTNFPK